MKKKQPTVWIKSEWNKTENLLGQMNIKCVS